MKHYTNKRSFLAFLMLCLACGPSKKEQQPPMTAQQIIDSVNQVTGVGKVVPIGGFIGLSSNTSGIIEEVFVQEGDSIIPGQRLLVLKDSNQQFEALQAAAQLASLRASHAKYVEELQSEQLQLSEYATIYETSKDLFAKKAETAEKLAADERMWKQQLKRIESLELDMRANQLKEKEIQLEVQNKQKQQTDLQVKSTQRGVLLEWLVSAGQQIEPQTLLGRMGDPEAVHIEAEVDELFAHKVKVGQKVDIRFVGRPEVVGTGTIQYVSPALSDKSVLYEVPGEGEDRRVRKIHVVQDTGSTLLINAKVDCQIKIN
jgi:multidrug efflux pump subunit AcrA (membrane-fusion protein)